VAVGVSLAAEPAPKAPQPLFPDKEVQSVLPDSQNRKSTSPGKIERLAPDSPLNGVADIPLFLPPSLQPQQRTKLTREQVEEIDRKKNWMFVDPKSDDSTSADKMLGVRKDSAMKEETEYKDLMQRHLEKGSGTSREKDDPEGRGGAAESATDKAADAKASENSFFILPGDSVRYGLKTDSTEARAFGAKSATGSSLFPSAAAVAPDGAQAGSSLFPSAAGFGRPGYLPEGALSPQKSGGQKEWASEFKQMLDGKPTAGAFGRGNDPVNVFADPTKQSLNPVIGVRPEPYSRPTTASGSAFTLPARPTAFEGFNRTPTLSGNSGSFLGTPPVSSPGFSPSPLTAPGASPRPGGFQELPKRKF
jgi:hypothetical protein